MNVPPGVGELMAAVDALNRMTKAHMDLKQHGPHCAEHSKYEPACVQCIEAAEEFVQ